MATSAKRPARGRWRPLEARAEEALRPGASIEAPELIQLIHEVNPSGHELKAEAERWRYQLKSRLQSLLIARFKEQLEVAPLPASPDRPSPRSPQDYDSAEFGPSVDPRGLSQSRSRRDRAVRSGIGARAFRARPRAGGGSHATGPRSAGFVGGATGNVCGGGRARSATLFRRAC